MCLPALAIGVSHLEKAVIGVFNLPNWHHGHIESFEVVICTSLAFVQVFALLLLKMACACRHAFWCLNGVKKSISSSVIKV